MTERNRLLVAGGAFFGTLVVMITVVALVAGSDGDPGTAPPSTFACEAGDSVCLAAQRDQDRPGIIPRPNEGRAPQEAGEPGGWEQVTLFFVIVAALGAIATLVVRSVRRSAATGRRTPSV